MVSGVAYLSLRFLLQRCGAHRPRHSFRERQRKPCHEQHVGPSHDLQKHHLRLWYNKYLILAVFPKVVGSIGLSGSYQALVTIHLLHCVYVQPLTIPGCDDPLHMSHDAVPQCSLHWSASTPCKALVLLQAGVTSGPWRIRGRSIWSRVSWNTHVTKNTGFPFV